MLVTPLQEATVFRKQCPVAVEMDHHIQFGPVIIRSTKQEEHDEDNGFGEAADVTHPVDDTFEVPGMLDNVNFHSKVYLCNFYELLFRAHNVMIEIAHIIKCEQFLRQHVYPRVVSEHIVFDESVPTVSECLRAQWNSLQPNLILSVKQFII